MLIIQRPTVEVVDEESNHRQRFAVGPLEPGFGHTLGNSLRRTLSSIRVQLSPGSLRRGPARVHDAHRVKEDVTDIILNLKDLPSSRGVRRAVTVRLESVGRARSRPATSS